MSNTVNCDTLINRHATDRRIERGISVKELNEGLVKGNVYKSEPLGNNTSKDYIRFRHFEIVCKCIPCHRYVKTIYIKK